MHTLRRTLVVFLVLAIGVALVGYYSYTLRHEDLKEWKRIKVEFTDVGGLEKEDPVMVNGHRVGRVGEIKLFRDRRLVVIVLEVEPKLEIRTDGILVEVVPTSALGSVAVDLKPGKTGPRLDPEVDVLQGRIRPALGGASVPTPGRRKELNREIKAFADSTRDLRNPETSSVGSLLFGKRRGTELRETLIKVRKLWTDIDAGLMEMERRQSSQGLLSREGLLAATETFEAFGATLQSFREGLRRTEQGESTASGFVADKPFATEWRDAFIWQRDYWRASARGEGLLGQLSGYGTETEGYASLNDVATRTKALSKQGVEGQGLMGVLSSKEGGENARRFVRGVVATTDRMKKSALIRSPNPRRDVQDFLGNLDDFLINLRRGMKGIRAGLNDKTFQGAAFAVF